MSRGGINPDSLDNAHSPRKVHFVTCCCCCCFHDGRIEGNARQDGKGVFGDAVVPFGGGKARQRPIATVVIHVGTQDGFAIVGPCQIVGWSGGGSPTDACLSDAAVFLHGNVVRVDLYRIIHDPLSQFVTVRSRILGCGTVQERGRS